MSLRGRLRRTGGLLVYVEVQLIRNGLMSLFAVLETQVRYQFLAWLVSVVEVLYAW